MILLPQYHVLCSRIICKPYRIWNILFSFVRKLHNCFQELNNYLITGFIVINRFDVILIVEVPFMIIYHKIRKYLYNN